jgi:hypothetical protein
VDVQLISSDIDGAELRQMKRDHPNHLRCDGRLDNEEIAEAVNLIENPKGKQFSIPAQLWDRIFGRQHHG